ncbi:MULTISPECIES: BREX-1 system adenine-specific DNA-methyltransferase PglX [unclassified Sporosarcina]|uniref:BREX-1 system adenine-specific DNA-methyltransferase PglX n=1 Tax=unclassified Sporosarcina TaxID=2647733 RepID=UPI002041CAD0|nr:MULTISPECIES: BREX-1 system adenine-specific DNA-methyltransferase PglX [unclassified Sporosarcina]GKV65496.1 hypothetical protein NCCP2331_16490 [Sporosarcina sp. NCCP-2331]GLB55621.1 hypothetical protein NCCP2378_14080 [Sporosarcina sp. NCCP-2378]
MDSKVMEAINQRNIEIERLTTLLNSGSLTPKELKKTEKEIAKLEKMNKKSEFWGGVASKTTATGEKLQQTGKAMQKAGLKTTAAVWTPAVYLGYKAVKSVKGRSPESDLVALVKECEEAHAAGKITEEQMKQYIIDFTNNYYRKE